MKYLMLTYFTEGAARQWETLDEADQQAEIDEHISWFAQHGAKVTGGEELAWPRQTAAIRAGSGPVVMDGPYLESKEILGGLIVLEAESFEEAIDIAAGWPSLKNDGALVEVVPSHVR
jgi:hypothetical protein